MRELSHIVIPSAEPLEMEDLQYELHESRETDISNLEFLKLPYTWKTPVEFLWKRCIYNLQQGCYQIILRTKPSMLRPVLTGTTLGTMRVEKKGKLITMSGDTYYFPPLLPPLGTGVKLPVLQPTQIPIFPRRNYSSYWKVTKIAMPSLVAFTGPCKITLTVEEYRYNHPAPGTFSGSFNSTPARTLKIELVETTPLTGYSGPHFTGEVFLGAKKLNYDFTMSWVSPFFRRATIEIDSLTGVAQPVAVAAADFPSIYKSAGWDLTAVYDANNLTTPAAVTAAGGWTDAQLHAFMLANRSPMPDLQDREWHVHFIALGQDYLSGPGTLGIMYDDIGWNREGIANFRNNFTGIHNHTGVYLRSAAHEAGHAFNQPHPLNEGLPGDNSIMSQTGTVHSVLGSGYPAGINFKFNDHNIHHLIHMPDVVVRPGGELFFFGHDMHFSPSADTAAPAGLSLVLKPEKNRLKLGEPLLLHLELRNETGYDCEVPASISLRVHENNLWVFPQDGEEKYAPSFAVVCDRLNNRILKNKAAITAEEIVFWGSNGFVFEKPGRYQLVVQSTWEISEGLLYTVEGSAEVWVDYPENDIDNQVAALLLDPEVGRFVALGGQAFHLENAVHRVREACKIKPVHSACKYLQERSGEKDRKKKG